MTTPTITVTVDGDGQTSIEVNGVKGPGCKSLTAALERALGGTSETRQTAEYTQQPASQQTRQSGGAS